MGVYDAHLATSPDAIPVAVRRTKEQAEACVRFCTAVGSFGQTCLVQMLPFDCCPHEGEGVADLTGRAKALAQEWKRRCDADGCYSPQHEMVVCATFHPELARLAQEAFRRQWPSPKAGEEEADEAAASLSSFEEPAPAGLTLTYDIYVKPPVPCNFITTKLTIEGPSESEADTGRWGVFDAQMLMAYPDTTLPVSVRATKEEAETEAAYLTPGNGRRGKRLHVAKMMPALEQASEDSSSGDGPDYQGPSGNNSSCSSTEQPNHHSWLMRLVGWIRGDRKPEDAPGSGKIIPSCGPPPPAGDKPIPVSAEDVDVFRVLGVPVSTRPVGMPKEFAAPYGDKPTSIAAALDKIDPDWRDKLQKSVGKYVSADDPLVAELLARGAAEARDLIDQAAKESGGQLPAILPAGQTEQLAEVGRGAVQWAKLIEEKDGMSLVNARLLHAELEVGKDFSNWIKDCIRDHKFVEHEHYTVFAKIGENPKGGRPSIDYHLDPESAKHIAAASTTEAGKDIRSYLIECERQLRTGGQPRFKQLETLPDPLPKLTHVSTLDERIDDLVGRGLRLMTGLTQDLKEIKKSVDNRRLNLQLKQESPMLPGIQDAELKAAKEHSAGLQATLTKIEKERDQLEKEKAELETSLEDTGDRLTAVVGSGEALIQAYDENGHGVGEYVQDFGDILALVRESLPPDRRYKLEEETESKIWTLEAYAAEQNTAREQLVGELAAATKRAEEREAFIRTLTASADTRDKELQRLSDRNRELEKQTVELNAAAAGSTDPDAFLRDQLQHSKLLAQIDILQMQLDGATLANSKLSALVEARDRSYDKLNMRLAEAKLETQRVLALVQAPEKDVTLTDFFKETESVLGYSDTMGIDYLVRTGVLYREKDELGKKYLWANHDYGCYFHHVARYYDHPITVDGQRTDKFRSVKTYTAKLIPDRKESGQVVKIGGYTWLKERMMEDELTTLQRLIAETGGATGEFKRLNGYVLSKAKEDSLPGLMSVGEKVILIAKGTGDFVGVRKGEWLAGCRTKDGTAAATGLTLRCSLATYRHGASW